MSKRIVKQTREFVLIESDRLKLVSEANTLIGHILEKQAAPLMCASMAEAEMSQSETRAFNAALEFLARQFETGFKESEVVETKTELETEELVAE
jgi:hypothetical protein